MYGRNIYVYIYIYILIIVEECECGELKMLKQLYLTYVINLLLIGYYVVKKYIWWWMKRMLWNGIKWSVWDWFEVSMLV